VVKGFCLFLLDCLFPRACVSCGTLTGGSLVCARCAGRIRSVSEAGRLPGPAATPVISPFLTGGVLLDIIRFLKFEGGTAAAGWLGRRMSSAIEPHAGRLEAPVLVPVPLHWTRLARRGYDQARLLASEVSRKTGIPLNVRALARSRMTKPQSSLDRDSRRGNINGAFRLRSARSIEGRDIILVDDLVTTGQTALACCGALETAGPSSIAVLCAGRKGAAKIKVECSDCRMFE
jgi:ComF family protein